MTEDFQQSRIWTKLWRSETWNCPRVAPQQAQGLDIGCDEEVFFEEIDQLINRRSAIEKMETQRSCFRIFSQFVLHLSTCRRVQGWRDSCMLGRKGVWDSSTPKSFEDTSRVKSNLSKPQVHSWKSRIFATAFFLRTFASERTKFWARSGTSQYNLFASSQLGSSESSQPTWNLQIDFLFRTCRSSRPAVPDSCQKQSGPGFLRWYLDFPLSKIEV